MSNRFHDLSFERLPDGNIMLTQQDGCGESYMIEVHPAQLRHVAEVFGLVAPTYRPDELTQQLSEQLGILYKELADECHRSHWLELTYEKLSGFMAAMPASIYPFHIWDDQPEKSSPLKKTPVEPSQSEVANAKTETQPVPTTPIKRPDGQLGLEV